MSAAYFLSYCRVTKGLPNCLDVPHSVLQQCEEKLRATLMHTHVRKSVGDQVANPKVRRDRVHDQVRDKSV